MDPCSLTLSQNPTSAPDEQGWTASCACGWSSAGLESSYPSTNDLLVSLSLQYQAHCDETDTGCDPTVDC